MQAYPWEATSTGIGRKLLNKMGWDGQERATIQPREAQCMYDKRGLGFKRSRTKPPKGRLTNDPPRESLEVPYEKDSERIVKVFEEMGHRVRLMREERKKEQLILLLWYLLSVIQ